MEDDPAVVGKLVQTPLLIDGEVIARAGAQLDGGGGQKIIAFRAVERSADEATFYGFGERVRFRSGHG